MMPYRIHVTLDIIQVDLYWEENQAFTGLEILKRTIKLIDGDVKGQLSKAFQAIGQCNLK